MIESLDILRRLDAEGMREDFDDRARSHKTPERKQEFAPEADPQLPLESVPVLPGLQGNHLFPEVCG
jgi:hypothetical protein